MSTAMSKAEREAFLAGVHVGMLAVAVPGRGPLAAPIWYRYEPGGDVFVVTGEASRKAAALRAAGHATLCVQTEAPPYCYVTVEGPVALETPDYERDVRQVAIRYLGAEMGERYVRSIGGTSAGSILVRLTPRRWLTVDYGKMQGG